MADPDQLRRAIEAQEQLRGTVPDDVIDATIAALQAQLPTPEVGRRRQITVLFADVSGFTALSEARDAELVMDLMNSLWQRLDVIVEEHGGRVDKHIGDALMAIWGAEVTREDDAERAVRAALALQDALAAFRARSGDELAMRVGVNTGPALVGAVGTTGESSAIGDAVNVASRLEHEAPIGGVLVSHDTWRHIRGQFEVEPVGRLQVKGKQDGVEALVVHRARPRSFRMATRGIEGVATHTIGRDRELGVLQSAFRAVQASGTARIITVLGDAGVGKSRLLDEFESWIELLPESVFFFAGRAFANRAHAPFALMRSIVANRFDILDNDPASTVQAKLRCGFATGGLDEAEADVVGHWIGLDVGDSPAVQRLAGSPELATVGRSHLVAYLRNLTDEDPTLVILEDIHWADDESIEVLTALFHQLEETPLFVVGVARPEYVDRRSEIPGEVRIELDALGPEATTALVHEVLQRAVDVPDELVELVVLRADGNAFFVEELVSMLIDEGVIVTDGAEWRIELDRLDADRIPATLTAVLLARLDGLAEEELRALQHAAVVGRVFWDAAVAALGPADDVVDALISARDRAFVFARQPSSFRTTTEYAFKHALLRDVTYETVLLRDRPPLHRAAAEWIEAVAGDRVGEFRELVADHYLRAEEPARAYSNLLAAGLAWRAKAHFGPARRGLEQAFTLAPEVGEQVPPEATIAMGEICYRLGDLDAAQQALDDVMDGHDDPVIVADAQFWASRIAETQGESARERALLDRAREVLEPVGGVTYARVLAALTQWEAHHGDLDVARAIGYRALDASEPNSIERTEAHAALVVTTSLDEDLDAANEHAQRAAETARRTGDLQLEASTLTNLGVIAHLRGDAGDADQYELADEYYAQAAVLARRIGMPALIGVTALNRAQVGVRQGRFDDAATLVRESLECAVRSGARVDMVFVIVIEADRLAELGAVDEALDLLAIAHRDPAANAQSRHEIEQVIARLGVPLDAVTRRTPSTDPDLDALVERILAADGADGDVVPSAT